MKSILLSVQPKWVEKILNGEKTIEIRKNAPKCELPVDVYIYCTGYHRYSPRLIKRVVDKSWVDRYNLNEIKDKDGNYSQVLLDYGFHHQLHRGGYELNSKVVAKFTLRKIETIKNNPFTIPSFYGREAHILKDSCLTENEAQEYLKGYDGYAWHISDLQIFDKPMELGEFYNFTKWDIGSEKVELTRPPQSWQYMEAAE